VKSIEKLLIIFCILLMAYPIAAYAEVETGLDTTHDQGIIDGPTETVEGPTETIQEPTETTEELMEVSIIDDQTGAKEVIVTEDYTQQIVTDTIPMRPLNVRYNNVTTSSISIAWDDNMGYDQVESYNIYVNGNKVGSSEVSAYVIDDLLPGRTYEITITAVNFYGESFESDPISVTTLKKPGIAPANIKMLNVTENSAFLTWEGKGFYNIYLNGEFIDTTSKTYYQLNNLESNTDYEVAVESYEDTSLYETIVIRTGQAIQQENVLEIIQEGFEYLTAMWPYMAVIAGLIIAFAIASMMLGIFENFRIG